MKNNIDYEHTVVALGAICEIKDRNATQKPDQRITIMSERALRTREFFTTFDGEEIPRQDRENNESTLDLSLWEFAELSDGQRVVYKDDRGWSESTVSYRGREQRSITGREVATTATLVLEPDDALEWLTEIVAELYMLGYSVDPNSVYSSPFRIEFGPKLQSKLRDLAPL